MIPFNRPPCNGREVAHVLAAIESGRLSGDGPYGQRCQAWFEERLGCHKALMMPSCTHALELAALLLDLRPGDEVIMPSYTFVSTANAFVLRGATIVFVDIRPNNMNIDERLIEAAITSRTRAIVPVHYAGIGCDMDAIMTIAKRHDLIVVEDAAQAMLATRGKRPLGSIGHLAAFSFHETKNYTSGGEGGLLSINDARFLERAEVLREKGTNRKAFLRGMVDKYTWVDLGSSYLPSELQSAYLWGQLEVAEDMLASRLRTWERYRHALLDLYQEGAVELLDIPQSCQHNGHLFAVKMRDLEQRSAVLHHCSEHGVQAVFHYVPLHSAPAGQRFGRFHGEDRITTRDSQRLLRLPLWHGIQDADVDRVVAVLRAFLGR